MQSQGDTRSPSAGEDSQEAGNEESTEQQQLDAMLVRLPEAPYSELPLGATIAHRPGHMVSCCTCNLCLVLQHAQVIDVSFVMRLLSLCPYDHWTGFSAMLQIRRGKWGGKSAVYKIWDLTRDVTGIHELFHEISILTQLQALQVRSLSFCGIGFCFRFTG